MEGNKKVFQKNDVKSPEVGKRISAQVEPFHAGKIKWLSLATCLVVLLVAALTLTLGAFSSTPGAHATSALPSKHGAHVASAPHKVKSPKHAHSQSSVGKSKPVLSVSSLTLSFNASAGSPIPSFQTVTINNNGTRALYWHASVSSSNTPWVTTSDVKSQPLGIRTSSDQPGQLKIYVNATGLKAAKYTAQITLTGTDQQSQTIAGNPQTIVISLTVS
jgi:hypothetical protein